MDQAAHARPFRAGRIVIAMATVVVAYVAFREGAPRLPLPPDVTKLILWFLIPLAVLLVQWRGDFGGSLRAAGFRSFSTKMFLPGLAALLAEGGTLIAYGARLPAGFDFGPLALSALVAPFAEELLFRGYLVNELAASGLSTARAFVIGGLLFGLAHLGNVLHQPPTAMLAEVGITAAGGMLFGWTLLRFEGSLWAAFAFHAALNLPWDAFGVDQTAIGGMTGNIARAAGVVVGIVAVRLLTRRRTRP